MSERLPQATDTGPALEGVIVPPWMGPGSPGRDGHDLGIIIVDEAWEFRDPEAFARARLDRWTDHNARHVCPDDCMLAGCDE
jgi:hypothetical protein